MKRRDLLKGFAALGLVFVAERASIRPVAALSQRDILVELYNATNGNSWHDNTGWLVGNPSDGGWHGVTVDGSGNVTRLALYNNNLTGFIPNSLGDLTSLTELYLDDNNLSGPIPATLGNLTALTVLLLENNSISE